jgi:5-methylcytosine-specific restriction enzyme subunit McrC
LIYGSWLASEEPGLYRFRHFLRDEKRMALVFQYFVYNFLRIERDDLTVFRKNIQWKAQSSVDPQLSLLPQMQTDISVLSGDREIVIDTKYYRETVSEWHDTPTIHSAHLYQLVSYLMNIKEKGTKVEGMLLYPTVNRSLRRL